MPQVNWSSSEAMYVCSECEFANANDYIVSDHWDWCETCDRNVCPETEHYCEPVSMQTDELFYYSYKPAPNFCGGRDSWHIGIELEIGARSTNPRPVYEFAQSVNAGGLFYCKQDGSVSGFEIVTHPM